MAWSISSTDPRRRGFSLAEAMMATTLLAIAVVGIAGPLGAAGEQSRQTEERGAAVVLARQLMEEIVARPLCDDGTTCHLGPESSECDRTQFNSADDYDGYSDTTRDLKNYSNKSISFDRNNVYTRNVTVAYRTSPTGSSVSSGDFGIVTVSVTTPHKQVVKIWRLLTKETLAY
jgi:type II secretory pathway pseudopilin PulG